MTYHHKNHHSAFVSVLNAQVEKFPDLAKQPIDTHLANLASVPDGVRAAVPNAGDGHWNHSFFWSPMQPGGAKTSGGDLNSAIEGAFGSVDKLTEAINQSALARFSSGRTWPVVNNQGKLAAVSTAKQDTPHMDLGARPVLGIDIWQHAYYLKHRYRRADYLKTWWEPLTGIRWPKIPRRHTDSNLQ